MGRAQDETYYMGATRMILLALGASVFPTVISPPAGCVNGFLQYVSGGSLEILPNAITNRTISGATAGALGFVLPSTPYEFKGPAAFYLACTSGSSALCQINFHFSSAGATLS